MQIPSPEVDEKAYRAVVATQVQTWASAAAAARLKGEALFEFSSVWERAWS